MAALTSALQGGKLLLISSSEGQRAPQHRNVINAAKAAGVKFIAYTSLLHADTSPLASLMSTSRRKMLADSGIVYTLLRNGWYSENYLASARRTAYLSVRRAMAKSPQQRGQIMRQLHA